MTTEQRGCIQVVETSKENDVDEAKQRIEHLEQSLKAAIEIHKLEVEALRAESLAEATEKVSGQSPEAGALESLFVGVGKDLLVERRDVPAFF